MKITVILCTYNRCNDLRIALESLAASRIPDSSSWEVLVVDNNSDDATPEVVRDFARRYAGRFQYLRESQPGKSHALNAGVREASGDVLAFVDDDVKVDPSWLANLTAVFEKGNWAGAGGRILPEPGFAPPRWLSSPERYAWAPLALFEPRQVAGELTEPPFGTNMAFRKVVFKKYGGFRTDLGPSPGREIPRPNEDTEFGRRLLREGEHLYYVFSAVVYHPVPEERLRKQYHLAWWFDKGRADVRAFGMTTGGMRIAGIPLRLFLRVARLSVRWGLTINPGRRFAFRRSLWCNLGTMKECFHLWRAAAGT